MILSLATYPKHAGLTREIAGVTVTNVPYGERADIEFRKYTGNWRDINSRPYRVVSGGAQYGTREAAVKAIVKRRIEGIGASLEAA